MNRRMSSRKTTLHRVLHGLAVAGVCGAAVGSGVMAYRMVSQQQYLVVKNVSVEGNTRISAEEVLEYAQVEMGASLYRLHPDLILRNVLRHPDVASATVTRVPPDGVSIVVTEHEPVATVAVGHGVYVVNREGRLFRRSMAGEALDLPVITGIPRELFSKEAEHAQRLVALALRAIDQHTRAGAPMGSVGEVEVEEAFGVTLQLGEPPVEVALGKDDFSTKFARLRVLQDHLQKKQLQASRIFLDNARHPERVALQLHSPTLAAVPPTDGATRP